MNKNGEKGIVGRVRRKHIDYVIYHRWNKLTLYKSNNEMIRLLKVR